MSSTTVWHWMAHCFTSQHFKKTLCQNLPDETPTHPATTFRGTKGASPKAGWCQGNLWGLISFCQTTDKDPESGVSRVSFSTKEVKYQNRGGFFFLFLRLLNPHIELVCLATSWSLKLVSSYLCSHGYCHEQCSGSCTNQHKGPRRDIFKIPRQKTVPRQYECYNSYTCLPLQHYSP